MAPRAPIVLEMAKRGPGRHYRRGLSLVEIMRRFPSEKAAPDWSSSVRRRDGPCCTGVRLRQRAGRDQAQDHALPLRIRQTCASEPDPLEGPARGLPARGSWGGRKKNRPISGRRLEGRGVAGKVAVGGILDRPTNKITATVLPDTKVRTIRGFVRRGVQRGATLLTDEATADPGTPEFGHPSVRRSLFPARPRQAAPLRRTHGIKRLKLLDLFCCAGGAARGYHDAGFDVVGVDIDPQPRYPYEFIQADVMALDASFIESFDAVHASPPCQAYSDLAKRNGNGHMWPRLIEPVRDMMVASGKPYVIENVEGAPLRDCLVLCGTMFANLRVIRHRLFETNFSIDPPEHKPHPLVHTFDKRKAHYGKTDERKDYVQVTGGGNCTLAAAHDAMGINWKMMKREINEAIPPVYAEFVGLAMIASVFDNDESRI